MRVRSIEGLRLVSALLVLFFHCQTVAAAVRHGGPPGSWAARTGFMAVDYLFVLSGFAQFLPLAAASSSGELPSWRGFALRRVLRIVPAYWLVCAATALYIGHFTLGPGGGHVVGVWELLIHLTFLGQLVYGVGGQMGFGINTALWTMTAEALFYITLPFVARRFLRHPLTGLGVALAIAVGWRVLAVTTSGGGAPSIYLVSQFPAFAFHFAVGMVAAMVVTRLRSDSSRAGLSHGQLRGIAAGATVWGVVALGAWMRAADPLHGRFDTVASLYTRWIWNDVPAAAFAILLVGVALAPGWTVAPFANPVVRWLGAGSYATYLVHILVMRELADRWRSLGHAPLPLWEIGAATAVEALLIGRASYLVIEEPCRQFARRVAGRGTRGVRPMVVVVPETV